MMAKFVPDPDEKVLKSGMILTLQGGKIKYPASSRFFITDRRFVWHDLGKWAFLQSQGALWMLLVKGKPVSFPHSGMRITHGKYALNKDLLEFKAQDGRSILVSRREKTLEMFREALAQGGIGLVQESAEEWSIRA